MTKSIVEARKNKQAEENMEDSDFSVGTIAGMEDEAKTKKTAKATTKATGTKSNKTEESVADMTNATIEKKIVVQENVKPELLEGTVAIKLKKDYAKLVGVITSGNDEVIVQEFDTHYQLNAKQIRVTRQDAERTLGKMNDGRWRMLFMNRDGELTAFNDYEFVLGVVETEVEERREQAQLNTRIDAEAKQEMDRVRALLEMTQAQFLEVAIKEFSEKVNAEML